LAYQYLDMNEEVNVSPNIVRVNDNNQIIEILNG